MKLFYLDASAWVRKQFRAFESIALNAEVRELACGIAQTRGLRGADCVHLASAIHLREVLNTAITMIASDAELLVAAAVESFSVIDPTQNLEMPTVD